MNGPRAMRSDPIAPRELQPPDRLSHFLNRISRALALVAGAIILTSAFLVAFDVASRALLGRVVFESFEFSSYGFAVAIALGLAHTGIEKANIRVDLLNAWMPAAVARAVDVLALLSLAGFASFLAWHAGQVVLASWQMGARSNSSLGIPLIWPQGLWAAGLAWFALVMALLAALSMRAIVRRDWVQLDALAGLKGARSASADQEAV